MLVSLIGYRATGKSTVAERVAGALGWDWVDSDLEIERRAGKPIREIFATEGEPAFRDLEATVLEDLCRRDRHVLALGGGVVLREENRQRIRAAGPVVWLTASPQTLAARIAGDANTADRRPNLTHAGGITEIIDTLALRLPLYRDCASVAVDTEGKSALEVADRIVDWLNGREGIAGGLVRDDTD